MYGQIGIGVTDTSETIPDSVLSGLASVNAGLFHTCGVTNAGVANCWGNNLDGELGVGDTTMRTSPAPISGFIFTKVILGWYHTCGVTAGSVAYCWGSNGWGELGDNSNNERTSPQAVFSSGLTFTVLTAGKQFTCGLASTSPVAYCWGENDYGQIGNGVTSTLSNRLPLQVVQ